MKSGSDQVYLWSEGLSYINLGANNLWRYSSLDACVLTHGDARPHKQPADVKRGQRSLWGLSQLCFGCWAKKQLSHSSLCHEQKKCLLKLICSFYVIYPESVVVGHAGSSKGLKLLKNFKNIYLCYNLGLQKLYSSLRRYQLYLGQP